MFCLYFLTIMYFIHILVHMQCFRKIDRLFDLVAISKYRYVYLMDIKEIIIFRNSEKIKTNTMIAFFLNCNMRFVTLFSTLYIKNTSFYRLGFSGSHLKIIKYSIFCSIFGILQMWTGLIDSLKNK